MSGPAVTAEELWGTLQGLPQARELLAELPEHPPVSLVGGAVRDLLRGDAPAELDLVVEGDAVALAQRLGGDLRRHDRFGTVSVIRGGRRFDLARARRERYEHPGALPEVEPASLAEDLRRRDFTVNALALRLNGDHRGELLEFPGGLEDLRAGRLRVLHPKSFHDDPTRLLRLGRYAVRLDFRPEPVTEGLARDALAQGALGTVSGTRLGAELRLAAAEPDPVAALGALEDLGVLAALDPALGLRDPERAGQALALLPEDGSPTRLILGLALEPLPRERRRPLLAELGFAAADRDAVLAVAGESAPAADALAQAVRPAQIAAVAERLAPEVVAAAGSRGAQAAAEAWLSRLRHVRAELSGDDLLRAGVPAGPEIARGLRAALGARLDGQAGDREAELAAALNALGRERHQ